MLTRVEQQTTKLKSLQFSNLFMFTKKNGTIINNENKKGF